MHLGRETLWNKKRGGHHSNHLPSFGRVENRCNPCDHLPFSNRQDPGNLLPRKSCLQQVFWQMEKDGFKRGVFYPDRILLSFQKYPEGAEVVLLSFCFKLFSQGDYSPCFLGNPLFGEMPTYL